jgi:hypothetical protein
MTALIGGRQDYELISGIAYPVPGIKHPIFNFISLDH